MNARDVMLRHGLTYRQVDYWARRIGVERVGSGNSRAFSKEQALAIANLQAECDEFRLRLAQVAEDFGVDLVRRVRLREGKRDRRLSRGQWETARA